MRPLGRAPCPSGAYWGYILASQRNGTLYVGVTNDLARRVWQHRAGQGSEFAAKCKVTRLVWCESHPHAMEAITREKQIKTWERRGKLELIESANPTWRDLYDELNA